MDRSAGPPADARLRWLIEHASDIVSVIRSDGTIQYESPSVERLLGWRPEELIGQQVLSFVHPDDVGSVVEAIGRRLEDPAPVNPPTEFRVRARDGAWRVLAAMSRVTRDEAGGVSLVVNSRDVTDERALEEQLRRTQRIESIGNLAGGVAHEFNNLLTVIIGRSQLLLRQLPRDEPLRRDVGIIAETAVRAAALTQQLLAFGRRQMLQPTDLDLNRIVLGIVPTLERLLGEQISVITSLDPGLDRVRADRPMIEQALVHLAVNAREAMPEGGRLSLTTANVELDEAFVRAHPGAARGPHVLLTVDDTGIGMDAETQARVFEPFFTTTALGRGTGLGLATVYGIVKQHEGYIAVESAPGRGTRFRVYLPRTREAVDRADAAADLGARAVDAGTILLVEDEEDVRELAKTVLEEHGYRVLTAAGGREAIEIAGRHDGPLDLLLTDVVMPGMTGRELADLVLRLRPETKVLFMSGYAEDARDPRSASMVGAPLLPKPFTLSSLTGRVAEILRGAGGA